MIECMDIYESGMSSIGETNGIWQNELIWWVCKGIKLLMEDQVKTNDSHAHREKQEAEWIQAKGGVPGERQCSGCGAAAGMDIRGLHTVVSKFCRECGTPMKFD